MVAAHVRGCRRQLTFEYAFGQPLIRLYERSVEEMGDKIASKTPKKQSTKRKVGTRASIACTVSLPS